MPVAVGPGRTSTRIGRRDDAEPLDPKQRKKQKQKMLVFGLAGVIGLLAIVGIVVAIVRSSSSGTPVASADEATTSAKTPQVAPGESAEDFGTRPGERKTGADTSAAKTAAEAAKPDAVKPDPVKPTPATAADPGWHTAGGDAAVVGDVSLKVPAVTLKTVTANRIRGKEVVGQVVIERLLVRVVLRNAPSAKATPYASWRLPKPGNLPTLADNGGKNFDYRPSPSPAPPESIEPGKVVEEVLVFQRPTESRKLDFLQLRLPAAAFGGQGTVDFKIPAAMIEPEPEKDKPGTRSGGKDDPLGLDDTPEQPKTPEKEPEVKQPPPKKDPEGRSIKDIEKDIDESHGGDKGRT